MYNYQNNGPPATSSSAGYPSTPGMGGGYPAGTGSITRFAPTATAAPTSSTPASFTGPGVPLYPPSSSSPYNFQPPPQPAAAAPINMAGMSFAQRSAMLQQQREQGGAGAYGGGPPQASSQAFGYGGQVQQQQQQQPPQQQPPSQPPMNVRPSPQQQQQRQQQQQKPPPQQGPVVNMAGMTFAQRSALMRQTQTTSPAASNVYGGGGGQGGGVPQYPQQEPQQQQQQQQQYGGASTASVGSLPQSNVYSPQRPQPQPVQQQQQHIQYRGGTMPPTAGGAPTMMMPSQQQQQQQYGSGGATNMNPQMQQPGMMTPPYMQPPMPNQPPPTMMVNNNNNSIYVDPPEVISQQNRLLTDATRKVQEHAYYMKQAMERHDLPTVLDRAAQMVGELGEHAHSHHHHQLHPPAPGASGTTTALSPKNYYELHLRALEELPTLEDYLLGLAAAPPVGGSSGGVYPPQQQQQQQQLPQANMMYGGMTPVGGNNGMMSFPPQLQQNNAPARAACTMRELYDYVQYCPNVLSRLYLQICAASALIRSGEVGTRWVLKDIIEAVKCVQNPVRGLFLRHYLLQAIRDKLPNEPILPTMVVPYGMTAPPVLPSGTPTTTEGDAPAMEVADTNVTDERMEKGTVKDSYEFILANFVQMNKLWVRIKHLPGDIKSKDIRRRREKDRNELRILVGTNLVRLSALDSVTSQIYGQVILPTVLDHIIISEDPLAQAYLIDCIVQVFPDEYHIETMPILLAACPKLRDKVNIRTILHSLMERLANYLADEELLDEADSNQVKRQMAQDSFRMMDECVQSVYNARGPKLQAKEVIRLQTALLSFSMKCYRGNLEQITLCLDNCVVALQQARANQALMQEARNQYMDPNAPRVLPQLEEVATRELEKLLSIPLDELALGVLTLDHYADLISFLPWTNRRQVALTMLEAVSKAGKSPASMKEIEELLSVIAPVLRDEHETSRGQNIMSQQQNQAMQRTTDLMAGLGVSYQPSFGQGNTGMPFQDDPQSRKDAALVSKLIHLLDHQDTDIHFAMLQVARSHFNGDRIQRTESPFTALVFASLKLAKRIVKEAAAEIPTASGADAPNQPTTKNDDSGVLEGDQGAESGKGSVEGEEPAVGVEAAANPQVGRMEKSVT